MHETLNPPLPAGRPRLPFNTQTKWHYSSPKTRPCPDQAVGRYDRCAQVAAAKYPQSGICRRPHAPVQVVPLVRDLEIRDQLHRAAVIETGSAKCE